MSTTTSWSSPSFALLFVRALTCNKQTSSSSGKNTLIERCTLPSSYPFLRVVVAATASATACVVWHVAYSVMVHRKRIGNRIESEKQSVMDHDEDKSSTNNSEFKILTPKHKEDDVEIFLKDTLFHRKLLENEEGLLCEVPWGLLNSHLASLSAQFRPSPYYYGGYKDRVIRRHQLISLPIGDSLDVEFFEPVYSTEETPSDTSTDTWNNIPMILLLHGINGHSTEPYIEQTAIQIVIAKGWRCVVLNYSKLRVVQHMEHVVLGGNNFMDSGDVNFLISYLRNNYAYGFLGAIGFSMGGAKLIQYLGRTGIHSNIDAAACVSSPLDFTIKNETVWRANSFIHRLYHLGMSSNLKLWLLRHYRALKSHPRLSKAKPLRHTMSGLLWWFQATRVTDIDEAITIHARGYTNLNEYYSDATAIERLRYDVKVPFLCITAKNDPFIPKDIIPDETLARDNSHVVVLNTNRLGGHIGYWLPMKGCWATKRILTFFTCVQDNQDLIYQDENEDNDHPLYSPRSSCCEHIPFSTACTSCSTSNKKHINPKELHRKNSLYAAKKLQKTSSTKLTDYMQLVDFDSVSSFGSFFGLSQMTTTSDNDDITSINNNDEEENTSETSSTLSVASEEVNDDDLERRQDGDSLRDEVSTMPTNSNVIIVQGRARTVSVEQDDHQKSPVLGALCPLSSSGNVFTPPITSQEVKFS